MPEDATTNDQTLSLLAKLDQEMARIAHHLTNELNEAYQALKAHLEGGDAPAEDEDEELEPVPEGTGEPVGAAPQPTTEAGEPAAEATEG